MSKVQRMLVGSLPSSTVFLEHRTTVKMLPSFCGLAEDAIIQGFREARHGMWPRGSFEAE